MKTAYKMYSENSAVVELLHKAEKPWWGCRCVSVTTPDKGTLTYTCAPCTARCRAEMGAYENPEPLPQLRLWD